MDTEYCIVTNTEGLALGRMWITDNIDWVEPQHANVWSRSTAEPIALARDGASVSPMPRMKR